MVNVIVDVMNMVYVMMNYMNLIYIRKHISFPTICDGFTELLPININGRNETDETECEYGNVIILIHDVMDFGIVLMELMKLIVIHHHY